MTAIRISADNSGWIDRWLAAGLVEDAVMETSDLPLPATRRTLRGAPIADMDELAATISDALGRGPAVDTRTQGARYGDTARRVRYWVAEPARTAVVLREETADFVEFVFWSRGQPSYARLVDAAFAAIRVEHSGRVRVLIAGDLSTEELPLPDTPMVWDNYPTSVQQAGRQLVDRLPRVDGGSLVILEGAPGTGKTYFIRGLIHAIDAVWVFVPPALVQQLGTPDFLPAVMEVSKRHKPKPIILIVEDADECLIERGADNISATSAILNLTDGILGRALNLRVVATTNAKRTEFDHALARAGRLAAHIEFPTLTIEQAFVIAGRLQGDASFAVHFTTKTPTLADVYAAVAR